jgi:hypothetical protein
VIVWGNQRLIRQGQGKGRGDAGMAGGHDVTEQSHLMIGMAQYNVYLLTENGLITPKHVMELITLFVIEALYILIIYGKYKLHLSWLVFKLWYCHVV